MRIHIHNPVDDPLFLFDRPMWDAAVARAGDIGTPANQIAPGKRMLSSQTPTIVTKNGKVVLITGSPGSRSIISTSLQVVLNVLEFGMDLRSAVVPRHADTCRSRQ